MDISRSDTSFAAVGKSPARRSNRLIKTPRTMKEPTSLQDKQPRVAKPEPPFLEISTTIPTISFEDLTAPENIQFSKRGSILIGGKRANESAEASSPVTASELYTRTQIGRISLGRRVLSREEELQSRNVRSMYENGLVRKNSERDIQRSILGQVEVCKKGPTSNQDAELSRKFSQNVPQQFVLTNLDRNSRSTVSTANLMQTPPRNDKELAGGIEDWENIEGGGVDRYGFISRQSFLHNHSSSSLPVSAPSRSHKVSTALQIASDSPRRQHSRIGRSTSTSKSTRSMSNVANNETTRSTRPLSSQSSYRSIGSIGSSTFRIRSSRLPYGRDKRILEEAGDMLTLPPGLADIAENEEGGRTAEISRRKEWEREAKWRKMAKCEKGSRDGGGMSFSFNTTDPKLIERTWKGIPDKWRATAWHAFLSASAEKRLESSSDEDLIACFRELLHQSSSDDAQIDIDVPRTISNHIMFRKRYRGGQRLLFRVLHCLSLFFPKTGYVQGMAALAATMLCYFDEEMAFVMLVRMWQLRGLERLYRAGFQGLMQALQEFEIEWLKPGAVGSKLTELGIPSTAYGTRWYLTLFNYSLPFPAQLRIWDIFLLLGDEDVPRASNKASSFHGQLDVLHATSAALIDATREILFDSDFENAMKVLTSWIPIRDEDLLMEVTKTEWKSFRKRV